MADIIKNVRLNGDAAILEYARKFDRAELSETGIEVSREEIDRAYASVDPDLLRILARAAENIRAFHANQVRQGFEIRRPDGVVMGQKITPIERWRSTSPAAPPPIPPPCS